MVATPQRHPFVTDENRDQLIDDLRQMRLWAAHLSTKLSRKDRTAHLAQGLRTRTRAIEHFMSQEQHVAVEEVRIAAELDALVEAISSADEAEEGALKDRLEICSKRDGELLVARARLDAHLLQEIRALVKAKKLLEIRLATV